MMRTIRPNSNTDRQSARGRGFIRRGLLLLGLCLGAVMAICPHIHARHYPIETYRTDSGLPQAQVISLLQDHRGEIWFGTYGGLCSFDGLEFHALSYPDGPRGRDVNDLSAGADGSLWVGSSQGVSRFVNGEWIHFDTNHGLIDTLVYVVAEDGFGGCWAGTLQGLYHILPDGTVQQPAVSDKGLRRTVYCLAVDRKKNLWGGTTHGVFCLKDGTCIWFSPDDGLFGEAVYDILVRSDGTLLAGGEGGVSRYSDGPGWEPLSPSADIFPDDMVVNAIAEDQTGHFCLGTTDGLWLQLETGIRHYNRKNGLIDDTVHALIFDYENNLWAGTNSGAAKIGGHQAVVFDTADQLASNWVWGFTEDRNGAVWISTDQGVTVHENDTLRHVPFLLLSPEQGIGPMVQTRDGSMVFGSEEEGILVLDVSGGERVLQYEYGLPFDSITDLLEDSSNRLWIGTADGAARLEGDRLINLSEEDLPRVYTFQFLETTDGTIWIVSDQGIFCRKDGRFVSVASIEQFGFMDPLCAEIDASGAFLVGTNGNGVQILKNGALRPLPGQPQWLEKDSVWALKRDSRDRLWIGTNHGAVLFQENRFRNIFIEMGLPPAEIASSRAILEARDGAMWFGCDRGAIRLEPGADFDGAFEYVPSLQITSLRINGIVQRPEDPVRLASRKDTLEIDFQFLSFRNPRDARYRYRLEGLDHDWSPFRSQTGITLHHLPSGTFHFNLEGISGYGVRVSCSTVVTLVIPQPFHETWWFRGALLAALALGTVCIIRVRQHRLMREKAHLESQVRERTRQYVESEEEFRRLVEESPLAIAIHQDERYVLVNQQMEVMSGWRAEELVGSPITKCIPPHLHEKMLQLAGTDERSGTPAQTYEMEIQTSDGSRRLVQAFSRQLRFSGQPAVMVQFLDVTEQKNLQTQFLRSQRMEAVGRLSGSIAHEFNNLLTVIMGYTELCLTRVPSNDILSRDLNTIGEATGRARDLTRALLAFGRQQPIKPRPIDPRVVIGDFSRMLRQVLGATVSLQVACHETASTILADPGQVEQVLMNLCLNARDAMPGGGTINIDCRDRVISSRYALDHHWAREGSFVCVAVTDTGSGMKLEELGKIFEPFFSTKSAGEGTGLGLSTVFGIIKQHQGLIDVTSSPGHGSTFRVFFPVATEKAALPEPDPKMDEEIPLGTGTILVVEDQDEVRNAIVDMLRAAGYTPLEARDGVEALERFNRLDETPQLILMDLTMPRMGGWETYLEMRRLNSEIRVLFASGHASDSSIIEQIQQAGEELILKPFRRATLLRTIARLIQVPVESV